MSHPALVVLQKEVRDNLRDRRAVTMALFFPLLGPVVLAMTLTLVSKQQRGSEEKPLALSVAGREHAPNLVAFLQSAGVVLEAAPADPERAVRAGDLDLVVVIPPEFGERLRAGRPAPVRLVIDDSRQSAHAATGRARRLLEGYGHQLGMQRLLARGVSPALTEGVALETVDLATPESRAALLLALLPYFVILAVFVGGMYIAIDATAGERERQSLEPLLLNPVPRWCHVAAKVSATALFASVALGETLIGFALVPLVLPIESLGFVIRLDPGMLVRVFLLALPLVLLVSSLQIVVAARARSFKAAQSSLSLLMMVPVLPGMMLAFVPVKLKLWMALVPTLGEQLVVARLLRGEVVPFLAVAPVMVGTALWAAVLFALGVRTFRGERIVFGA